MTNIILCIISSLSFTLADHHFYDHFNYIDIFQNEVNIYLFFSVMQIFFFI